MLLKDLKDEDVKVELRVWNKDKTLKGTIVQVFPERENDCRIVWDNGTESMWWAYDLNLELVNE